MTDAQIQALIDNCKAASGDPNKVDWVDLANILTQIIGQQTLTDIPGTAGQVLKHNGTTWAAGTDEGSGAGSTFTPPATLTGINPDNSTFWEYIPSNNGTTYSGYGKAMYFSGGWAMFNGVNTSGRPNVVGTIWGYNHQMGGGRVDTAEASMGFRTETHFEISGQQLFEIHFPEFIDQGGTVHRIFSWYIDKSGTEAASPVLEGAGIGFTKWGDGNNTWCTINHTGDMFIKKVSGTGTPKWTQLDRVNFANNKWDFEFSFTGQYTLLGKPNAAESDNPYTRINDNLQIGENGAWKRSLNLYGNAFFQNGYLFFGNTTTANAINGSLFVESGALKFKGGSGTVTTIANA